MTHTPGPWKEEELGRNPRYKSLWQIVGANGEQVMGLKDYGYGEMNWYPAGPEDTALILTAPDMLAALKALVPMCAEHQKPRVWVRHDPDGTLDMCEDCYEEWLAERAELNRPSWRLFERDEHLVAAVAAIAKAEGGHE